MILLMALMAMAWPAGLMAAESADPNPNPNPIPNPASAVTNGTPPVPPEVVTRNNEETLRSYLRLQEQLHTALLAIEQSRLEASAEARTNAGELAGRLAALEIELADQRAAQARSTEDSHRMMIYSAAGILLVGVIAMVFTAVFQARGMNRLAEIATGMSPVRGLGTGIEPLRLGDADRPLLGNGGTRGAEGIPGRLQSTIRRLEGRIREIEVTAQGRDELPADGLSSAGQGAVLLGKAQALLHLGQPDAAVDVLNGAIAAEPDNPELYLRKGLALERLSRLDQAIEAYDRAIAIDGGCTRAFLSKGAVLNQQERYQEALLCYEQALESHSRS